MSEARRSTESDAIPLAPQMPLDFAPHLPLHVVLLPPVHEFRKRRDRLVDERRQIAVGGVVGGDGFPSHLWPCLLQKAVDGVAARLEPNVLRPGLLPLKLFPEVREELELLGGIQPFQPVLFDDLFQPLAKGLVEDRVLLHANVDLVADGVLHLARLGVVGLQRLDLLVELG